MCVPCKIKVFQTETSVGGRKWSLLSNGCADCAIVIFRIFTGLRKQHIIYTMKAKFYIAIALAAVLLAASCSSGSDSESGTSTSTPETIADTTAAVPSETATTTSAPSGNVEEETSLVVPFTAANGSGTVTVSGDGSPVVAWVGGLPGEVSLDLVDADVGDVVSVVEELVSFWFFQDDDSGDVPPSIYVSASGDITDSVGTRYVVEAQGLPPAPVAETTTTTSSTSTTTSTTSSIPETSEPSSAATSSTTTSTSSTTTTTTAVVESPVVLQVQVLNGSGVAGAAGRMTDKLSQAGYVVLSPENAPQRYSSSAVYFAEGWQDKAEEILRAAEIDEIEAPTAMPQQFASEEAAVVVLLGTDTAPAVAREQAGLRPRQRNDVQLPLPDSVPRDRYVPGLAAVNMYTEQNESNPASAGQLVDLALFLGRVGYCHPYFGGDAGRCQQDISLQDAYQAIEDVLGQLGFTPQNVCGAPAGYSFTDLLKPTREWNETFKNYSGDAIFTTERLLELHGGERINPEANLEFYIQQAVQTAHDALSLPELSAETEAMQLVLCGAFLTPSGEVPEMANSLWYANLTPGIQPRESLLSQGTYHVKEISRNGNFAYLVVCHPTIGARFVLLHWREAGYRAEIVEDIRTSGCQSAFEEYDSFFAGTAPSGSGSYFTEDTISFSFGERVFSADNLLGFPRS